MNAFFKWFTKNLNTLFVAFILAVAVWVLAVSAADPDEVQIFPRAIAVEIIGQDPSFVLTGDIPEQLSVTLRAPRSVWNSLNAQSNPIRAVVDLSGLSAGDHAVEIQIQIDARPVRVVAVTPSEINLTLEPLITRAFKVETQIQGNSPIGYKLGDPISDPINVIVSGAESKVKQVAYVRLLVDVQGVREDIKRSATLGAFDENGQLIEDVTITPPQSFITLPISQEGGYRDIAVKVLVQGQVAKGYRLTNITVYPPVITVYSPDPKNVIDLPGFVETSPLNLNGMKEDGEVPLALLLPKDVSVVGNQNVVVQVSVTFIESSITIANKPVEIIGLGQGLTANISPQIVDVILSGPLPLLDQLKTGDVRVVVDLSGLTVGTHQLSLRVEVLVADILVQTINPSTVEVTITPSITPTP